MSKKNPETNWDTYYSKPYRITNYTRKTTEYLLLKLFDIFCKNLNTKRIVELGGANSCFYDAIKLKVKPKKFHVVDNNKLGLKKFKEKIVHDKNVSYENASVLDLKTENLFDISFSIGLIEHFDKEGTAKAIKTHFDIIKKDGITIISFPTPTFLYRITRKICEIIGIWFFHDERPLEFEEVIKETQKYGEIIFKKINWKVLLTQGFIVAKKQ